MLPAEREELQYGISRILDELGRYEPGTVESKFWVEVLHEYLRM